MAFVGKPVPWPDSFLRRDRPRLNMPRNLSRTLVPQLADSPGYFSTYSMVDPSDAVKEVFTQRPASSNHWSITKSPV